MWYVDKRRSNWNNITHIHCTADKLISVFLFTFITHKLWESLVGVFTVS